MFSGSSAIFFSGSNKRDVRNPGPSMDGKIYTETVLRRRKSREIPIVLLTRNNNTKSNKNKNTHGVI